MFCIMLLAHCTVVDCCFPLLVFLLWVEPGDEYVIEEPVEYAHEDHLCQLGELSRQDDHTLEITSVFAC